MGVIRRSCTNQRAKVFRNEDTQGARLAPFPAVCWLQPLQDWRKVATSEYVARPPTSLMWGTMVFLSAGTNRLERYQAGRRIPFA